MISQNITLWVLVNTQFKGGYSHRKKYRMLKNEHLVENPIKKTNPVKSYVFLGIIKNITFDWIGFLDGIFNKMLIFKHSINLLTTRYI